MDRAEHRLLLACVRACRDEERRDLVLDCLSQGLDWEYLLRAAGAHRLTSLLYWYLDLTAHDSVPPPVLDRLHQHFLRNAAKVLLLTARLQQVLAALDARCIRAIPYKGPALAHSLYEDPGAREFDDLDILVQRDNVQPALEALAGLGYRDVGPRSPRARAQQLRQAHHWVLEKDGGGQVVEVHWTVMDDGDRLSVPVEEWWQRRVGVDMAGHEVLSLSPEDLLVALFIHGSSHCWSSLRWVADVTRLLARAVDLDWDAVRAVRSRDLRRIVRLGSLVAADVGGASIPDTILTGARRDAAAAALSREVGDRLFDVEPLSEAAASLRAVRFRAALRTTWPRRYGYLARTLLAPTVIEWDKAIPPSLYPAYYLLRPLRLLRKHRPRRTH